MEKLEADVLKAIENNLPSQTAGVLKNYLREMDELKKAYDSLEKAHSVLSNKYEQVSYDKERYESWKLLEVATLKQIDELYKIERERKVFEAETRLQSLINGTDKAFSLLTSLFRNTEYREDIFKNQNTQFVGDGSQLVDAGGSVTREAE